MQRMKIDSATAAAGPDGQISLAAGERTAMRMWRDEQPARAKPASTRAYETVGYVIGGRATLHLGDDRIELGKGDSWLVPAGAPHAYEIHESFSAIEVTSPPAPH
ncbi:MAG: cupin domain-containing protein [Vulcanimicrobiaceae bacterium]